MALNVAGVRIDPVGSYNFLITLVDSSSVLTSVLIGIQNVVLGGFTECSGLEMSLDVEEYQEGGRNGTVLKFPTRVTWTNIRLRRGVALSDDLWNWHYGFVEGKGKRRDGIIVLQNDLHIPVKVWHFTRGLPVKWTGPSMDATQSQVAIEELEIAHEGLKLYAPGAAIAGATGVSF
jgi:phage tail-like protein